MGVDSILGYNLSVQTKNFTKRITLGATGANQTQGLSESEKLENFKKEIWKEIDSMSWGSNISVQITDSAFEKMMVDKEFKNKMMNIIREDARGSNMMCGGTLINIDENGYKGYSYSIKSCKACRSAQKCALYARLSEAQEQSSDTVRADSNADYLIHYAAVL